MDRFMFDDSDRVTLQRYARQCFASDLSIGLLLPVAPFLRLVFCGNLRMVDSARIRVVRHDERCAKAFSEAYLRSAAATVEVKAPLTVTGSSGLLKQELAHRMTTKTVKKKPQEALQRLVIPTPPLPAKPIIPRAEIVMNFSTYPALSPIPELPEAAEAEEATEATPIPIPGQPQQPAVATGWHYLVGSDDEAMDEHFAATATDAPGAGEVYSVPPPPLGAQIRRNRATEAVYRPYDMTSSTAEYNFTPPEARDVEGVAEDEDGDVQDGSPPTSSKEKALTTCPLSLPWPIPKCKQHHIPPQYYYPKQRHLPDDYWRLSCPLLTGFGAISGSGASTRSGSRQGGSDRSSPISSADSSIGNLADLKAIALTRGCVSMSSALPVMRWRNREVEYGGSLAGDGGFLTDEDGFETDEDEDMEEEKEEEEEEETLENSASDEMMYEYGVFEVDDEDEEVGMQTQGSDLSSGSSESGSSGG